MERRGAHGVETIAPPQEMKRASGKASRAKNLQVPATGPNSSRWGIETGELHSCHSGLRNTAAGAPNRLASKWLQRRVHPDDCSGLLILEEQDVHARQAVHVTSSREHCGHMQREFCAKKILENVQRDVLASLDERSKQGPKPRKNGRPTSSGASGLEAATPGCCLRLRV